MTFSELFAAQFGRGVRSIRKFRIAQAQVLAMPPDLYACWVEYRDRRLEARHG